MEHGHTSMKDMPTSDQSRERLRALLSATSRRPRMGETHLVDGLGPS